MIQFNLLPEVKKEYVKAKRQKRLIVSLSTLISIGSIAVVIAMFLYVQVAQKKHINDLTKDIKQVTGKINQTENLVTILTVQNQLSKLPELHQKKPETSRFFGYITFLTPEQIEISSTNMDLTTKTIVLQGEADTIATVNRYVDNLKAARYVLDEEQAGDKKVPFTQVATQLSGDNEKATFKIDLIFESEIFDNTKEVKFQLENSTYSTRTGVGGTQ